MPKGKYYVYNSEICPKLTIPFSDADYFANEQVEVWGKEPFSNLPKDGRLSIGYSKYNAGEYLF